MAENTAQTNWSSVLKTHRIHPVSVICHNRRTSFISI